VSLVALGLDLVDLDRAARLLRRHPQRALTRLLTAAERADLAARSDPVPGFAARLAAKEAGWKALQILPESSAIGWRDLEVVRGAGGRPTLRAHGRALALITTRGLVLHLSLTHSPTAAAAVVALSSGGDRPALSNPTEAP
jgi:holo-[acyl-carrier protein] synthase